MALISSHRHLKYYLNQVGLLHVARSLNYWKQYLFDPIFRRAQSALTQDFIELERVCKDMLSRGGDRTPADDRVVLIVGAGLLGISIELILIKAFQLAGFTPVVLMERDDWCKKYYRMVGVQRIICWDEVIRPVRAATVDKIMENVRSLEGLLRLDYDGIRIGKYAASTAFRDFRHGHLDLRSEVVRRALVPYLRAAMEYAEAAKTVVRTVRPRIALSTDTGYSPRGELFDACVSAGAETITWNAAHRSNSLMLKRYSKSNREVHPASLSRESWEYLKRMPWKDVQQRDLRQELLGCYSSGDWYSEVGTQFNARILGTDELSATLGLSPEKKTAIIFPHIFWDGTFFWGTDLFASYEEWFVETVRAACSNDRVNWIIKIHPANLVKNARDGLHGQPTELLAITRSIGDLPKHITIIPSDSPVSTFSLFSLMDYCITVRGTIGIESASFGIPVLTAGTGRYNGLGFTIDSTSKSEYLDRLACIEAIPSLSSEQRKLAERFAYGVFVLRPFMLRSVRFGYRKDSKASLETQMTVSRPDDLETAEDLQALAGWIKAGREDILVPGHPEK